MNITDNDKALAALFKESKTVAVVGIETIPTRDSFRVGEYLQKAGYTVFPVTPSGEKILGLPAIPLLEAIPAPVDIVVLFSTPEDLPVHVDAAIRIKAKALWLQTGLDDQTAEARASEGGLRVVMDRCIRMEHERLAGGE